MDTQEKSLKEVQKIFENDRFATENGAVIEEVGELYAKCSIVLNDSHKNAMGAVMGGVYFTLADFAFAVAANWKKMGTVSINASISYVGKAKGQKLIAEAVCVKNGRTTALYNVEIKDDLDTAIAMVTIMGYHV